MANLINHILRLLYAFLFRVATDPTESKEVGVKKIILAGANLLIFPYILSSIIVFYYLEEPIAVLSGLGFMAWSMGVVFVFPRLHKDLPWRSNAAALGAVTYWLTLTLALGGFENSGYTLPLFGLLNPLIITLINLKPRQSLIWLALHIVSVLVVVFLQPYLPVHHLPSIVPKIIFSLNVISSSVMYVCIFFYFINQRNEAFRLLHTEREKSEKLLLNILPYDIALILKAEERVIADHFPSASVLFADIVNFTPLSAKMTPVEVVELLNEVFSDFDELVEKYGLEKIKTIGDCYMVAAGVPRPCSDHAQLLTRLALDMRDYANQHEIRGKQLKFRIGLNSGPVVAGVIGRKKFIYDLWGDAVNTASRMESHGAVGFIQVTESTYELIKRDFICEPQGVVNVKGKGDLKVWYVLEKKA